MKTPIVIYREKYWFLQPNMIQIDYNYYINIGKHSLFKKILWWLQGNKEFDYRFERILLIYEE